MANAANKLCESIFHGSKAETKPKPIVSSVLRNGGSNLVGDTVRRGSTMVGECWRWGNYLNEFASTNRGASPVFCENELRATSDFRFGEGRRSAGRMKPQVGDSVAQPKRASDPLKFNQVSSVDSFVPVLVLGTRNGMTPLDYPPPKPILPCYDGDPLTFWIIIRSFDTHIAAKIPNDAARIAYLLQHYLPNVRRGLEHF